MDVQAPGGGGAELLQDAAHRLRHVVGHHPGELQLAVDDHAALPEVQDLQVLESRQVGLQVRQQLRTAGGKQSVSQPAQAAELRLLFCWLWAETAAAPVWTVGL